MPWLRFTDDFDFKPVPAVTLAYRDGDEANVTRDCATAALAARKAVRSKKPGAQQIEIGDDDSPST